MIKKGISSEHDDIIRCTSTCIGTEKLSNDDKECVDDCGTDKIYISNGVQRCISQCPSGFYEKDNICVNLGECDYYDPDSKKCYDSCNKIRDNANNIIKPYHNLGSKECINTCLTSGEYKYKNENDKICYKKEDCKFIDESEDAQNQCLISCPSTKFYNYDSNICINNCGSSSYIYHPINSNICYPSCSAIPGGSYIYQIEENTSPIK